MSERQPGYSRASWQHQVLLSRVRHTPRWGTPDPHALEVIRFSCLNAECPHTSPACHHKPSAPHRAAPTAQNLYEPTHPSPRCLSLKGSINCSLSQDHPSWARSPRSLTFTTWTGYRYQKRKWMCQFPRTPLTWGTPPLTRRPPGTGKTLIARQLGKVLNGKEPKVVNGPEILNK